MRAGEIYYWENTAQKIKTHIMEGGEKKQPTSNKDLYFQVLNRFTKHKKKRNNKQEKKQRIKWS